MTLYRSNVKVLSQVRYMCHVTCGVRTHTHTVLKLFTTTNETHTHTEIALNICFETEIQSLCDVAQKLGVISVHESGNLVSSELLNIITNDISLLC